MITKYEAISLDKFGMSQFYLFKFLPYSLVGAIYIANEGSVDFHTKSHEPGGRGRWYTVSYAY